MPWKLLSALSAAVLSLAWASLPPALAATGPAAASLDRERDSYAIYSLLLPGELLRNQDASQSEQWAIADTTISAADINPALAPEAALRAPTDHPKWFRGAVDDYNARKYQRLSLTREFLSTHPYVLLSASEVDEFRALRTSMNPGPDLRRKYLGIPGITYFSEVYFDPGHTGALVYMSDWCGSLCAQAEWVYLEKHNGQWVRRSGQASIASHQ